MSFIAIAIAVLIVFEADRRFVRREKFKESEQSYSHKEIYILLAIAAATSVLVKPILGFLALAAVIYLVLKRKSILAKLK